MLHHSPDSIPKSAEPTDFGTLAFEDTLEDSRLNWQYEMTQLALSMSQFLPFMLTNVAKVHEYIPNLKHQWIGCTVFLFPNEAGNGFQLVVEAEGEDEYWILEENLSMKQAIDLMIDGGLVPLLHNQRPNLFDSTFTTLDLHLLHETRPDLFPQAPTVEEPVMVYIMQVCDGDFVVFRNDTPEVQPIFKVTYEELKALRDQGIFPDSSGDALAGTQSSLGPNRNLTAARHVQRLLIQAAAKPPIRSANLEGGLPSDIHIGDIYILQKPTDGMEAGTTMTVTAIPAGAYNSSFRVDIRSKGGAKVGRQAFCDMIQNGTLVKVTADTVTPLVA